MSIRTLADLVQHRAIEDAHKVAYVFLDRGEDESVRLTYAELFRRASDIASEIKAHCGAGDRVLILCPVPADFVVSFVACSLAGVVAVPSYPPGSAQFNCRLQGIVKDASIQVAIASSTVLSSIQKSLPELAEEIHWIVQDQVHSGIGEGFEIVQVGPSAPAILQYTSGSTGVPKGVLISHEHILANALAISTSFGFTESSRVVMWVPLSHDMGLIGGVVVPLFSGISDVLISPMAFLQKPARWLRAISEWNATVSGGPNFAYDICVDRIRDDELAGVDLSAWQVAFCGAENVNAETLQRFAARFEKFGFRKESFLPCYGLAENTLIATSSPVSQLPKIRRISIKQLRRGRATDSTEDFRSVVSCGPPVDGTKIVIVDPAQMTVVEEGEIGEVWIAGPSVGHGYYQKPNETNRVFRARLVDNADGPFLRTGDLGFLDDNELYITGRLRDRIRIRSLSFYPEDIEATVIESHASLAPKSVAFSVVDAGGEQLVVMCEVVRSACKDLEASVVIDAIRASIVGQHHVCPNTIVLLQPGTLPKTPNGKSQRHVCRDLFISGEFACLSVWQKPIDEELQTIAEYVEPPQSDSGVTTEEIDSWLIDQIVRRTSVSVQKIREKTFAELGLDSLGLVSLSGDLSTWLSCPVSPTLFFEFPTIRQLSERLCRIQVPENSDRVKCAAEPIAVVGMACRFPGADDPEAYWRIVRDGCVVTRPLPEDRRELLESALARQIDDLTASRFTGGFLDDIDQFDADFFSCSDAEAASMDPQQRLLLEVSWEAFENAGIDPHQVSGTLTGVYVGVGSNDYRFLAGSCSGSHGLLKLGGNSASLIANRLSYFFNFCGPSQVIDTACSSSLVAVHQACESLRQRECNLAVTGGVNALLDAELNNAVFEAGMLSPTGHCRPFDKNARGYIRGEGCGVIILKRLADAQHDGDNILAILKGSAVGHNGTTNGITAPSSNGQFKVLRDAIERSGLGIDDLRYIETHGTGTPLGDPIEIEALHRLHEEFKATEPLWLGACKANIGHLEAAAGIAGLMKVILALQHEEIPQQPNFNELNPLINFKARFQIPVNPVKWDTTVSAAAGCSSFGFGGTNAHIIVQQAPKNTTILPDKTDERAVHVFTLSARSETALRTLAGRYVSYLRLHTELALADICYSANCGRSRFPHRLGITARSVEILIDGLSHFAAATSIDGVIYQEVSRAASRSVDAPRLAFAGTDEQLAQVVGLSETLMELFVQGAEIDFRVLYPEPVRNKVTLPTYPFQRRSHWVTRGLAVTPPNKPESAMTKINNVPHMRPQVADAPAFIAAELRRELAQLTQRAPEELDHRTPISELGADSIVIAGMSVAIEKQFGVEIGIRRFLGDLPTLHDIAVHISNAPSVNLNRDFGEMGDNRSNDGTRDHDSAEFATIAQELFRQQTEVMQSQLRAMNNWFKSESTAPLPSLKSMRQSSVDHHDQEIEESENSRSASTGQCNNTRSQDTVCSAQSGSPALTQFAQKYESRFRASKFAAQKSRSVHADNRCSAGFRVATKELQFPIYTERSEGARFWDIDGNEFVDLSMGFGVNFFGHNPDFVRVEIEQQLKDGIQLGPHTALAGRVAQQIADITGVERVAFCNSGTESVMTALRIARAVTHRRFIAMFRGSYHGHFDGTLAAAHQRTSRTAIPITPGTTENMLADVLLLDYGDTAAFATLHQFRDELAAVLVEPIQSRRPGLQPREFVHELRRWTTQNGVALIFDEMITGFRIHPRGAQGWYNVDADIVTYGKVVGGGLPIGVVAGQARFLDAIDGGTWQFGDDSSPHVESVFFAGTFCKHPLTMRAASTVLRQVEAKGPRLQKKLNSRTSKFVASVNSLFQNRGVPISVAHCGSMFRFESPLDLNLFFSHLIFNGIYVWEGRTCFLSTAHEERDLQQVLDGIAASVDQMFASGFFSSTVNDSPHADVPTSTLGPSSGGAHVLLTADMSGRTFSDSVSFSLSSAQRVIWEALKSNDASRAFNIGATIKICGPLNRELFEQAIIQLTSRHESLRMVIAANGKQQIVLPDIAELSPTSASKGVTSDESDQCTLFDFAKGPLYQFHLSMVGPNEHLFTVNTHYLVSDGWSLELLFRELWEIYQLLSNGHDAKLKPVMSFREYLCITDAAIGKRSMREHESFWLSRFNAFNEIPSLPTDFTSGDGVTWTGVRHSNRIPDHVRNLLRQMCAKQKVTEFTVLFAAFELVVHEQFGTNQVVVGVPTSGRDFDGSDLVVGHCVNVIPVMIERPKYQTPSDHIQCMGARLKETLAHRAYPFAKLLSPESDTQLATQRIFNVTFNKDKTVQTSIFDSLFLSVEKRPLTFCRYDLSFNLSELGATGMTLDIEYKSALFAHETIEKLAANYLRHLENLTTENFLKR